jgi:hypothetical protein
LERRRVQLSGWTLRVSRWDGREAARIAYTGASTAIAQGCESVACYEPGGVPVREEIDLFRARAPPNSPATKHAHFVILAIATSLAGCGDSSTAPVPFEGTWNLRTYGGQQLPATVPGGLGLRTDVLGSSLSIAADGTWSETFALYVVTATGGIDRTLTSHGTYDRVGTMIDFTATDDPEYMDCEFAAAALTCDDKLASYTR